MKNRYIIFALSLLATLAACGNRSATRETKTDEETSMTKITFLADSAYSFIHKQCDFGPRVPNTDAHSRCGDWLEAKLKSYGAAVTNQRANIRAFDGTVLHIRNIVGEFYPEKTNRILLVAHWDSRPWADNDPDEANHRKPVMAANDGASGVGVLLEIARLASQNEPSAGIDILFVDAEDWGDSTSDNEESWALGAQYWSHTPHRGNYVRPHYGILLDMVGDENATFYKEYFSTRFAPQVVQQIWNEAARLGFSGYFVDSPGGAVTDDHLAINAAGIPCIDIIDQREGGFCPQWHTADDTMRHISRTTLTAVGQTLVNVLF